MAGSVDSRDEGRPGFIITTCWEPSSNKTEPYPLPNTLRELC